MIRRVWWILLVLFLGVLPAGAQDIPPSPLDWIPHDFAGFVRLNMTDANVTLNSLNSGLRAAFILQPTRFSQNTQPLTYESILPLGALFDVEDASFVQDVLPWLGGDVVLAYRQFDGALKVDPSDMLMILPTNDMLLAAGHLHRIIAAQDLGERSTYRDTTLYIGDKSTLAITPQAVLVGATELVQAALDVHAGQGESLAAQPEYQAIQRAVPDDAVAFAYAAGSDASNVLNALVSGKETPEPLLAVAGEALREVRGQDGLDSLLLTGRINSAGFVMEPIRQRPGMIAAKVMIYAEDAPTDGSTASFDSTLLDLIPRSAMVVHRGTDVQGTVYDLLVALPLSNFGGRILGAFPVDQTIGSRSGALEDPTASDVGAAVSEFMGVLQNVAGFDLKADFLDHLSGSYVAALLPNPNRPVPFLNTPFDLIFLAKVDDGEAALAGATRLLETILGVENLPTETLGDQSFTTLRLQGSGDAVLRMGVVDGDTLVVTTGDSIEEALAAQRGDNRLTNEGRWQVFTRNDAPMPELYVDINSVYNTFFPSPGGMVSAQNGRIALAANTSYTGDGLYTVDVRVSVPG